MTTIHDMFPRRHLHYSMFAEGEVVHWTIRRVMMEQATIKPRGNAGQFGRSSNEEDADAKAVWLVYFNEHRLPLKVEGKSRAAKIAISLGTEVVEEWIGRKLTLYHGQWENGGQTGPGLMIDTRPEALRIPQTDRLLDMSRKGRIVPAEHMNRFREGLAGKGKNFDDFLRWLKDKDAHAFAAAHGEALDAFPATLVPAMKAYLDFVNNPPSEVIDARPALTQGNPSAASLRGAVGGQPAAAGPSISQQAKEFVDDDIPF